MTVSSVDHDLRLPIPNAILYFYTLCLPQECMSYSLLNIVSAYGHFVASNGVDGANACT